jgi:hypothetical protein
MAIRFKTYGGGWTNPIAPVPENESNTGLRVKWGGPWIKAGYVRRKMGDPGGGYWHDTGYRGPPNPPQNLRIYDWTFSAVSLQWDAPAGGVPAVAYHLVQADANLNWLSQVEVGGSSWGNFGVVEDGRYQFFARSKSAEGLYSDWAGPVRVQIGHTEQGYWGTEQRTRSWETPHYAGAVNRDVILQYYVPSNVVVTSMTWWNLRTPCSSIVTPDVGVPGWERTVNWWLPWADHPINQDTGTIYSSGENAFLHYGFSSWGNNTPWGIVPRGGGWSAEGDPFYMLHVDDFHISGIEYYDANVFYVTRPYQANGYW